MSGDCFAEIERQIVVANANVAQLVETALVEFVIEVAEADGRVQTINVHDKLTACPLLAAHACRGTTFQCAIKNGLAGTARVYGLDRNRSRCCAGGRYVESRRAGHRHIASPAVEGDTASGCIRHSAAEGFRPARRADSAAGYPDAAIRDVQPVVNVSFRGR